MNQPSPIPPARGNKKLLSARNVLLAIVIFLGISVLLTAFNSATNKYSELHALYNEYYYHDGSGAPVGHYRVKTNSVYYYKNCSDPFNTWCKLKLEGVKPGEFEPISKNFARVSKNDNIFIYNNEKDVTDKIANPREFRALEKIEADPEYFFDGSYVYFLGEYNTGNTPETFTRGNRGNVIFPIKLNESDNVNVPDSFQEDYFHYRQLVKKILFINDDVYLNGNLIQSAEASSFVRLEDNCINNKVGPWFKDKTNVYYNGHMLSDADPNTFKVYEYSNFGDEKRDLDTCHSGIGSDKNNVYYPTISFSAKCDGGSAFCTIYSVVPGVSPNNVTVQTNQVVLNNRIIEGERFSSTIMNNDGAFYLDGSRKTDNMVARVYIEKDWGKEHREINARKGQYSIYYWIYSPECVDDNQLLFTKTMETYSLKVNSRHVDQLNRCHGVTRASLRPGINSIELVSDDGEILYRRDYIDVNW